VGLLGVAKGFTHEHRLAGVEPALTRARGLQKRFRRRHASDF